MNRERFDRGEAELANPTFIGVLEVDLLHRCVTGTAACHGAIDTHQILANRRLHLPKPAIGAIEQGPGVNLFHGALREGGESLHPTIRECTRHGEAGRGRNRGAAQPRGQPALAVGEEGRGRSHGRPQWAYGLAQGGHAATRPPDDFTEQADDDALS